MAQPDYVKSPNGNLNWNFNWSKWLEAGETIIDSTFATTPGLTIGTTSNTATTTTVRLSGGSVGHVYRVTNSITTSSGNEDSRSITISVEIR